MFVQTTVNATTTAYNDIEEIYNDTRTLSSNEIKLRAFSCKQVRGYDDIIGALDGPLYSDLNLVWLYSVFHLPCLS